ncbi:MAG: peptidoglycan DD-metalloendopeptidase family protein [Actinomycetota bacterium]|nr:peptidoglycan DD-metalloendopeptidase family protein [Actinomycetota bacterium]
MKFVVLVLALSLVAPAGAWQKPVDGAVVRPFDPPATRFGAGHQGVDFAATPGTPVRAAGPGTVTFAGMVAGARHVVVGHDGDLRTSYSFLATSTVRRGDEVERGDVIGTTGGTGPHHDDDVSHFGLRRGEVYSDPMKLFAAVDLASVVHLAPVSDPFFRTVADERGGLLDGLGSVVGGTIDFVGGVDDVMLDALVDLAEPLADLAVDLGADAFERFRKLVALHPIVRRTLLALTLARGALAYAQEQFRCDRDAPAADGEGGSGHRVMLVAGIDSKLTEPGGSSFDLEPERLGYASEEATYFSYSGAATYRADDTLTDIETSARELGEQLKAMQIADPGREVDLVAHSQGGVVVLAFLELVYDPGDPDYPPLGTVITFASPLDGAPLATLGNRLQEGPLGWLLVEGAERLGAPPIDGDSTQDLVDGSDLMDDLDAAERPGTVELTTIGGAHDFVVPANVATTDGARHTVVAPRAASAHSGILTDDEALRAARSALEGRDELPCRGLGTFLAAELFPPLIEEYTYGFGDLIEQTEGPARLIPTP